MTRLGTTFYILAALLLSNVLAQGGSCTGGGGAATPKGGSAGVNETLASGVWGGPHVRMEVGEKGVNFEFDCGAGSIDRPVALDGEGRFDAKGTFVAEHHGPVLRDEEANTRPARYKGRVRGDTLTLAVTFDGGGEEEEVGTTYTLTRGSEGRLMKCR
jgi:hypothetical protein